MLKQDGLWRGKGSIHVRRHRKLGKHKTIIREAVSLVEQAIAMPEVGGVELGKIFPIPPHSKLARPAIDFSSEGKRLRVAVTGRTALQIIFVRAKQHEAVERALRQKFYSSG